MTRILTAGQDGIGHSRVAGYQIDHASIEIGVVNSAKETARDLEVDLIETDSFQLRTIRCESYSKADAGRNYSRTISDGKSTLSFRSSVHDRIAPGGRLGFTFVRLDKLSEMKGQSIEIEYRIRADKFGETKGTHVVLIDDVLKDAITYISK